MLNGAAQAFIAFLRCEATQAEERAKSLRATAAAIEANNLEAKRRKRKRDPNAKSKKAHSAYTLFVHENYETIKKNHADVPSKEIISIMARQWATITEDEKQIWKYRAEQMKDQYMEVHHPAHAHNNHHHHEDEMDDDDGDDEVCVHEPESADDGERKRTMVMATKKSSPASKMASVSI